MSEENRVPYNLEMFVRDTAWSVQAHLPNVPVTVGVHS
jgi:hypothetical protein